MSLGNTYDNNKRTNSVIDPTVYSAYKMNNAEGQVDQTCISFNYWNNSLKITIAPKKDTVGSEGQVQFDYDNGISIYLNHTKARILAEEIKLFLQDPTTYDNCGVPSGQGLITISRGVEFNSPSPLIFIRKIDENGAVISSFAYQTKSDYFFAVRGYQEDGTFVKEMDSYRDLEIRQIVTILEEFYKSMTYAISYTVANQSRFEQHYMREWRNAVSTKLGIEIPGSGNNNRNYSSTSYFNNSSGNKPSVPGAYATTRGTLDDID